MLLYQTIDQIVYLLSQQVKEEYFAYSYEEPEYHYFQVNLFWLSLEFKK